MSKPTETQRKVLDALAHSLSLEDGRCELSLESGVAGAALASSIAACQRNGWIGEDGRTSDAGLVALKSA